MIQKRDSKFNFRDIRKGIDGAAAIAAALLTPFLQSRRARWGATDDEIRQTLPGDELVSRSKGGFTHAININATATSVWPWLVQMGQGRGGLYSYEFLENLVGCQIHNADRIITEFQHLEVGNSIRLHPKATPYSVAAIEPDRALILNIRIDSKTGSTFELTDTMPDKYLNQSWVFFLDELDKGTTRLISRSRNDWNRSLANALVFGIFGPISLIMDRKMLLGIKRRAEAVANN